MKKLLSIIGAISLITSGSSNLIGCNNTPTLTSEELAELKEKNSKIINGNKLEWIAPQEKPFNTVDNKWYVVIWRGDSGNNWRVVKFQNKNEQRYHKFDDQEKYYIQLGEYNYQGNFDISINQHPSSVWTLKPWQTDNRVYFKSVYRWSDFNEPPMIKINIEGKIKN